MIRQQPITTEEEFMEILANNTEDNPINLFVQWSNEYVNSHQNWPQVELLENFLWIHTNPNDAWWYIENGDARVWRLFPNLEERNLPWKIKDK